MLQDRLGAGKIDDVAETCLETEQLTLDRETPAIDAGHGVNGSGEVLHIERLLVQRDAQFLATAQADEVIFNLLRLTEQAVREGGNQHGGIVVQGQQASEIAGIDGVHPGFQQVAGVGHCIFFQLNLEP